MLIHSQQFGALTQFCKHLTSSEATLLLAPNYQNGSQTMLHLHHRLVYAGKQYLKICKRAGMASLCVRCFGHIAVCPDPGTVVDDVLAWTGTDTNYTLDGLLTNVTHYFRLAYVCFVFFSSSVIELAM